MKAVHTDQQFKVFMSQLKETNATLDFFCDFEKISSNVERIRMKLNQLNYLIGQPDMDEAVKNLWEENPKVFSVLDILIAVRKADCKKVLDEDGNVRMLESYYDNVDKVLTFIDKTGLKGILLNKKITNLVDYVFGVETGLDTNARKNRSGSLMEDRVEQIFREAGIGFFREVYSTEYPELSILGEDKKRFDFVVDTPNQVYLIEVNFYSSGGSKLNEVARSYSELAPKINAVKGFRFVWITDGQGWMSARNKLEEAYYLIPDLYNLSNIHELINEIEQGYIKE